MAYKVERRIRTDLPQVGYAPYRQVHAHSTGNSNSTVDNEANYMQTKDINRGFYTHVVGNGKVIQVGEVNRGAWDVGGGWNAEGYASVELIESHKTKAEFTADYKIYCELLHDLAVQAGIPVTVDTGELGGIKTHNYCTNNQPDNGSDHVDPIPYLAKWGIGLEQFRKDVVNAKQEAPKPIEKGKFKMFAIYSDSSNKQLYILNVATGKESKITNDERKAILADNVMKEMVVDFGKANRTSLGKSNEALKKFR